MGNGTSRGKGGGIYISIDLIRDLEKISNTRIAPKKKRLSEEREMMGDFGNHREELLPPRKKK